MKDAFSIRVEVRGYELDGQGHLNQAVYSQYAEHARWKFLQAAGFTRDRLNEAGIGPVVVRSSTRFQRELRAGDEVDVFCEITGGRGKLIEMSQRFQTPKGMAIARIDVVVGLLDINSRTLLPDPQAILQDLAVNPELLAVTGA